MAVDVVRAYRGFDEGVTRLVLRVLLPVLASTLLLVLLLRWLAPTLANGPAGLVLLLAPVAASAVVLAYPVLRADSRRAEIDRAIHMFVTHMAVLATSSMSPVQILDRLGRKTEYGALAEEARRIHALVDAWNMSLSGAARLVAKRTPSRILSDFLDRFAYSLDSGENLEGFLRNEQIVVMEDYAAAYRGSLYDTEGLKHLYSSMMMSIVFLGVFSLFVPILTGIDAPLVFAVTAGIMLFTEVCFVFLARVRAPHDPVWYEGDTPSPARRMLFLTLPWSLLGVLVAVAVALLVVPHWPPGVRMAIAVTPLLYTGVRVLREEERVSRRDTNYPAFIRSLGASATARGGSVADAVRHLQYHDFGPLTDDIRALYRRLTLRVDPERAWAYFGAESGSHLVSSYSRFFVEGLRAGGRADEIGRILSENGVRILGLRKERAQTARTFRGLLAGLVAGVGFSLFVGLGILDMLQRVFDRVASTVDMDAVLGGAFTMRVDLPVVQLGVAVLLLAHCAASALIVRHARGGDARRALVEFVAFAWIAGVTGMVSMMAVSHLG